MSPKVPKAYLEARRSEILQAAIMCFGEKGFHNTTMQDIYKATNLSPGAVYNYFTSKEDIVATAVEMSQQRNSEFISEAAKGDPDQALSKVGENFITMVSNCDLPKMASLDMALYSESVRNVRIHEALRAAQKTMITGLAELVKHSQKSGVFNSELDPKAIAQALASLFIGIEIAALINPEFDLEAYAKVFMAIGEGKLAGARRPISGKKAVRKEAGK